MVSSQGSGNSTANITMEARKPALLQLNLVLKRWLQVPYTRGERAPMLVNAKCLESMMDL